MTGASPIPNDTADDAPLRLDEAAGAGTVIAAMEHTTMRMILCSAAMLAVAAIPALAECDPHRETCWTIRTDLDRAVELCSEHTMFGTGETRPLPGWEACKKVWAAVEEERARAQRAQEAQVESDREWLNGFAATLK